MRKVLLILSAAAFAATSAAAQNEVAVAPADNGANAVTATDINAVDTMNMVNVTEPVAAPPPAESDIATRAAADDDDTARGIPWGLLGLVGLIGLLGRRRSS